MGESAPRLHHATDISIITQRLAAPFPVDSLGWLSKSKQPHNGQVRAVPYLEISAVKQRLTDVLGIDGWQTHCTPVPGPHAAIVVELRIRIGDHWVTHADVGAAKPKGGDPHQALQAAASNGLKRAAESIGIGAYLKRLPAQWLPWDAQRERIDTTRPPKLPAWACPATPVEFTPPGLASAVGAIVQELAQCKSKELFALLRYSHRYLLTFPLTPEQAQAIAKARAVTAERLHIADRPEAQS